MRKLVVAVVTCALAAVAIMALLLATLELDRYRGLIEAQASRAIGRKVAIGGELDLALSLRPRLVAADVTVANPGWASRPDLARIGRVEATAAVLPLIVGRIEIERIAVTEADVALERDADGAGNWQGLRLGQRRLLSLQWPSLLPRPARAAEPEGDLDLPEHFVGHVDIRDARVTYRDRRAADVRSLTIVEADFEAPDGHAPITLAAAGDLDGGPFDLEGELGPLTLLLGDGVPYPVALDARWQGLEIRVAGTVLPGADPTLDLRVSARAADAAAVADRLGGLLPQLALAEPSGPLQLGGRLGGRLSGPAVEDLQAATRLFGVDVTIAGEVADLRALSGIGLAVSAEGDPVGLRYLAPSLPIGTISATGHALGGARALELRALRLRLGRTDLAGELTLLRHGERPKLVGRLSSRRLSLPVGPGWHRVEAPVDTAPLRAVDVDVRVETDLLVLGPIEASQASLDVRLDAGVLSLDRLRASLAGSPVEGLARLDASGAEPTLALRLDAASLDLGALLAPLGQAELLDGQAGLRLDLATRGAVAGDWPAALHGTVRATLGDGSIASAAVQRLLGLAPPPGETTARVAIDCVKLDLDIAGGAATARTLLVESPLAVATGAGSIRLDGGYDLAVKVVPPGGDPGAALPIHVFGPLDAPEIGLAEPGLVAGLEALLLPPAMAAAPVEPAAGPDGCAPRHRGR